MLTKFRWEAIRDIQLRLADLKPYFRMSKNEDRRLYKTVCEMADVLEDMNNVMATREERT